MKRLPKKRKARRAPVLHLVGKDWPKADRRWRLIAAIAVAVGLIGILVLRLCG